MGSDNKQDSVEKMARNWKPGDRAAVLRGSHKGTCGRVAKVTACYVWVVDETTGQWKQSAKTSCSWVDEVQHGPPGKMGSQAVLAKLVEVAAQAVVELSEDSRWWTLQFEKRVHELTLGRKTRDAGGPEKGGSGNVRK